MAKQQLRKADPQDITRAGGTLTARGILFDKNVDYDDWLEIGQFIQRAEVAVQWWIGDWLNYGEGKPQWGDKYEQAISMFGLSYSSLTDYKSVASNVKFSERSENLSWSHHSAVASTPPATRTKLLEAAAPESPDRPPRMSVAELKKEVKRIRQEQGTPALPEGKYRVIYADPPWQYDDARTGTEDSGAAVTQYEVMPTECICALHCNGRTIGDLAAKDSVLFLWATAPMLPDAMQVMAAWGFKYKAQFVWNKVRGYNGHYNDVCHELLLVGTRGSWQPVEGPLSDSVLTIEKTIHSAKPDEFYELIESLCPITKPPSHIELFARRKREGWKCWGNQAP